MVNITASFILAAYVLYIVSNGDLGKLMRIVGVGGRGIDSVRNPAHSPMRGINLPSVH